MSNNKQNGTSFERLFCKLAKERYGFWAHMMTANAHGQPADIIIVKNNIPALIDCKDCENGYFKLSRVEDNQESSMEAWIKAGNKHAAFALRIDEIVWMITYRKIKVLIDSGFTKIKEYEIKKIGLPFEEWAWWLDED